MPKEHLPIYQIQDFKAQAQREHYYYFSTFAAHLQEHRFIREPHKHDFYILLFVTQGTGTHTIDFKTYEVKPDTVFFMIPGQVHSWELSEDADGFVIFFTHAFYAHAYPDKRLVEYPFFNALLHHPMLLLPEESKSNLLQVLHLLGQEYNKQDLLKEVMLSRLLDILLVQFTRVFQLQEGTVGTAGKELVLLQNLERLIDQHYREHVPVHFYAANLHVTGKHLNEVCKGSLGKTTLELVQYRTLLEAKRLLVHSALTASQVAAELGYFDNTYFFRFFKKHTGCTPEQFRAANR